MKSGFFLAAENIFTEYAISVTPSQIALFETFFSLVTEKNKVMNLTRITGPEEAAQKHFFDSVSILKYMEIKQNASLIDIGTGAGFPGIPLKILRPDLQLTLVDSSKKKIDFLNEAAKVLDLDIRCVYARAEELCIDNSYREGFDIAISRAVASLPILLEICTPFVKKDGYFIAYKGADFQEELNASQNALKKLDCNLNETFLAYTERSHALLVFQKLKRTDKIFPRKFSAIKKRPL